MKHSRDLAQGAPGRPGLCCGAGAGHLHPYLVPHLQRLTDLYSPRPSLDRNLQGSLRGHHQVRDAKHSPTESGEPGAPHRTGGQGVW